MLVESIKKKTLGNKYTAQKSLSIKKVISRGICLFFIQREHMGNALLPNIIITKSI